MAEEPKTYPKGRGSKLKNKPSANTAQIENKNQIQVLDSIKNTSYSNSTLRFQRIRKLKGLESLYLLLRDDYQLQNVTIVSNEKSIAMSIWVPSLQLNRKSLLILFAPL